MSADQRHKDAEWALRTDGGTWYPSTSYAGPSLAVLMDIRDELKKLNAVFACPSFLAVPSLLRGVEKNTRKPRKKKARTR
mgnify:FL=1